MILDDKGADSFDVLRRSGYVFYLTGSRYMGCARPDSDWDFMVQDSFFVRQWLKANGFTTDVLRNSRRYGGGTTQGSQTADVWEQTIGGMKIQVQLVQDVQLQRKVRDVIKNYLPEKHRQAKLHDRKYIWDTLAEVIGDDPLF